MKKLKAGLVFALITVMALVFISCDNGGGGGGARFTEGVFIGEADGMKGPLQTRVVFSRNAILDVQVVEHNDTLMFAETPITVIPPMIVQHQSLDIEVVSGATITSFAILGAVEDAVIQANGDADRLWGRRANRPRSTEVVDLDVEIVIVGAGAAGKGAAVFAAARAPQGSRILLLEKMPGVGGNAILSGGAIQNINLPVIYRPMTNASFDATVQSFVNRTLVEVPPPAGQPGDAVLLAELQTQLAADWATHQARHPSRVFDSRAFFILEGLAQGVIPTQQNVTSADNITLFADWLNAEGMRWQRPVFGISGFPWPRFARPVEGRLGEGFFIFFDEYIRRNNLQIDTKMETRATELIVEGDSVVGVRAVHISGRQYNIRSNRGVVLATGGYSANFEMIAEHADPPWPQLRRTTNHSGAIGDGIRMGRDVGAATMVMNMLMVLPVGDRLTGTLDTLVGMSGSGPFVNRYGSRFVDESAPRNDVSMAIFNEPGEMMFAISSAENHLIVDGHTSYGTRVDTLLRRGQLYTANTLEALASQIGIAPGVLTSTINDFNAAVLAGNCALTGRTFFPDNAAILNPPFYASPRVPAAHMTPGGLLRAPNFAVMHESMTRTIPGLFAIGEVAVGGGLGVFAEGKILMTNVIYP